MKIAFLTTSLEYGGAERQLVSLATGLHANQHEVVIIVCYGDGPLANDLRRAGVPIRFLNKRGRWDQVGFVWRLIRAARAEQPDILHSYLGVPNLLTILIKPLFPHVKMVWGVRSSHVDLSQYSQLSHFVTRLEVMLSPFADLIIVNSQAGRDYQINKGFAAQKLIVIPNGIDTDQFCPDPAAREQVRAEWGIADQEMLIGLVARLDPMKDHPMFLRAAALLAQERSDVRFVCVGDGPEAYHHELQRLNEELHITERVIWAGARRDMPAVYNALDICASSSYGEGFPNVIGEAMACGVPCVATDVGDSAWIIGDTGIVVPPRDPQALADGWHKLLDSQVNHEAVRARIVSMFSRDTLIKKTAEVLGADNVYEITQNIRKSQK